MSLYLFINLAAVAVPFIFSFHPRLKIYKMWFALWPAIIVAGSMFIAWDILFTHWKVWGFNPKYLNGIYLYNLPIEEIIFFICVPYCCLFTYECLKKIINLEWTFNIAKPVTVILALVLILLIFLFPGRLYTDTTFALTSVFILLHQFVFKTQWLGRFYFSWLILLFPFLIVNGVLTGSFIEAEVVWYNDHENMGIRLATIPVEDTMYGMLLILLAVSVYEFLLSRSERRQIATPAQ